MKGHAEFCKSVDGRTIYLLSKESFHRLILYLLVNTWKPREQGEGVRHRKNNRRVDERADYGRFERREENEKQRNLLRNFSGFGPLLRWMI